ncbi:MAG: hypothetical protein ABI640_21385 [Gammaproteobacteria bacterium]
MKLLVPVLAGFALFSLQACAQDEKQGPTDAEIRRLLVDKSIADYAGACPCPESVGKNGQKCGKNSAYSKPGTDNRPLCYPSNVSAGMIKRYREQLAKP